MAWKDADGKPMKWEDVFPENWMEWGEYEQWELKNYPFEISYGDIETVEHVCAECDKLKPCKFIEDPFEEEMAPMDTVVPKEYLCHPCYRELEDSI